MISMETIPPLDREVQSAWRNLLNEVKGNTGNIIKCHICLVKPGHNCSNDAKNIYKIADKRIFLLSYRLLIMLFRDKHDMYMYSMYFVL